MAVWHVSNEEGIVADMLRTTEDLLPAERAAALRLGERVALDLRLLSEAESCRLHTHFMQQAVHLVTATMTMADGLELRLGVYRLPSVARLAGLTGWCVRLLDVQGTLLHAHDQGGRCP